MVAVKKVGFCRFVTLAVVTLTLTFGVLGIAGESAGGVVGRKRDDFRPADPAIWRNDTSNNRTSITVHDNTTTGGLVEEGSVKAAAALEPTSLEDPPRENISDLVGKSRGSGNIDRDGFTDESAAGSEGRNATLPLSPTFAGNASGIINRTAAAVQPGDPTAPSSSSGASTPDDEWPAYPNVTHTLPDRSAQRPPNATLQQSTDPTLQNITSTAFPQIITEKVPNNARKRQPTGYMVINNTTDGGDVSSSTGWVQDDGVVTDSGSVPYKAVQGETTDYASPGQAQTPGGGVFADRNAPINNLGAVTDGGGGPGANAPPPTPTTETAVGAGAGGVFPGSSTTMSWTAAPWNASVVGEPIDYVVVGVSCFTLLVGCIGNLCVLCTVCRHYSMRSVLNILIASLAVSDLLQVVLYVPLNAYTAVTDVLPFPGWGVEVVCRGLPVLRALSLGVTVFSLCAFSVDRYRASVNVRLQYEQYESCCRTMEKVFVVWLGALILAVPDAFPPTVRWYQTLFRTANAVDAVCPRNVTKGIPKVMLQVSATYYDIKTWWLLGCYFCLPVLFGLVCFCLSSRRLAAAARANKDAKDSHKLHLKQSHQTARIVLFLVLAFAFCWLPYHVSTILWRVVDKGVLQKYRTYMVILDYAGFYLSNFQSCVNPLVLFTMSEAWRKALNDCCPCCYCFCCCCRCVEVLCCPGRRSSKDDPDKLDTELQTVTGASR
ncbi:uncharacterized protein LOC144914579 [Branchiostoma floridae x Branchiostoma belcheri]